MPDESRPEFEAPDQHLDGSDRPVEQPPVEPPEQASEPPPKDAASRWPGMARRPWVLGAAALAVAVAIGGTAWALNGSDEEPEPARFTSMPAEPCSLVPGGTLEQYVPNSDPPVPGEAKNSATERYIACEWSEPPEGSAGAKALTAHRLNVAIRLHLDGQAGAKSEYDAAWAGAKAMAGTAKGAAGALHAEAPVATRIGEHAFTHYSTLKGPLGQSGTAAATVHLRNAVITVRYTGTTSPLDKGASPKASTPKPLDEAPARSGAENVARGITNTLAACTKCLTR
ncbi:hypothetical protein OHR68_32225 [Spirillospora sp. NBC_00431]